MTDEPKVGTDEIDASDQAVDDVVRRPSPSAQAASRARRIGGRPAPGSRPAPSPTPTPPTGPKLTKAKATTEPSVDTTARRGGLRAARAAATERTVLAERTAGTTTRRPAAKPAKVAAGDVKSEVAARRRRVELGRWVPAVVLGVAVVVLSVLCFTYGNGVWHGAKSSSEVRGEVLSAAKTCTAKVSSYDYRKLAEAKKDGQSCATGKFKKDYTTAMDTIVAKEAPKTKTTQSVQVAKAGVEQVSSDGNQWTLLIYGQHTVTNTTTGTKTPRLDKLSVRVTMDKVGDKWLISKLNLVDG